ncbi:glycosyltransferase [Geothrix sp. 21YS21S-2]|uniref:glycosyltransferase n=1 Tax=Geothrix sp. 21YS21S-2 TaxID=3068893 RepID=UPI0027BAB648|nr:glycosyltransferase [Geothrix sp. 21YS21S-2]
MDVVFLTDHLLRGGADAQLTRIAITLQRRGWKVGVLTMLPSVAFTRELAEAGIPCHACADGMPWVRGLPFAMAFRMTLKLLRWKPAVLITFNYHGDIMGRVLGRLAGVRAIVSSFRTAFVKTPGRERLYRRTERLIDVTAANSHAGIRYLVARNILTPGKTLVIHNGIIASDYPDPATREEVRAELGLPDEAFVWLAVGNLLPSKDYATLMEALGRIPRGGMHLLVAGGGTPGDLEALRRKAAQLGLGDRVHVLGSRSDVPRLLRACDAYVLSSAWEGMPNTVMEAMASGVPVVSTDAGGVRELLVHGASGFIVPCRDPGALAGRMVEMMALSPEKLLDMGTMGRGRVAACFDNERILDRWEILIKQLIRSTAKRRSVHVQEPQAPGRPQCPPPAFVISLDFELFWGVRDKRSLASYGENILGERQAIPAMLALFRKYGVKATWAAVGMAMFERKSDLLEHLPDLRPSYRNAGLDPYLALKDLGPDEKADPYHFGSSLVKQVLDCEGMELGSHTFSHYYCLEEGQEAAQFRADLEAWLRVSGSFGVSTPSFVFPRNQANAEYLAICSALGFKVFRGNESAWMYAESRGQDESQVKRAARLIDNYLDLSGPNGFIPRRWLDTGLVNCPSSRFLRASSQRLQGLEGLRVRRIQKAMETAAMRGESFHLWWHPHNFGTRLGENLAVLEALLRHHCLLRDRYGVVPMTMGEVGQAVQVADGVL